MKAMYQTGGVDNLLVNAKNVSEAERITLR